MFPHKTKLCVALIASISVVIILYSLTKDEEDLIPLKTIESVSAVSNPKKLFDLDLKYVINSEICANASNFFAILLVTSYFGHVELRSAMRRAFPKEELRNMKMRRVFLLGEAPTDKYTQQNQIVDESNKFGDIIQGNFNEAYRNLTYKHLMGLKWASESCPGAKYIMKMDDDIVVNLRKIVDFLKSVKLPEKLLAGYILRNMKAIREKANKWFVSKAEYGGEIYPAFVSGWFYVTNPSTTKQLVSLSYYEKYFWIDDLYVTGILANKLRIKHYDISKFFTVNPEFFQCCMRDVDKNLDCDVLVGPNGGDNNLIYTFNEKLKQCSLNKCLKITKSINETCVAEFKINLGQGSGIIQTYKLLK